MENPKISVIIPIYNIEYYLEETLDNLVNQTFIDNMEVIMIDDGSTDDSKYIIEKYALNHENFYAFHKKNEGQCVARNFGLLLARGEYVHFMDSDDLVTYDAYEKLYKFAKKEDYDVISFNYLRFDSEKSWQVLSQKYVYDEFNENIENTTLYDYKLLSWDMPNCNKLMKRELLKKYNIKYYYKNIIYEDNLFMIELFIKAKKIAIIQDYIYFWRFREIGTSTTQKLDIDLGEKLYEMVYLVNKFITENITDKEILNNKYEKLLTINLYFFILSIKDYPKKHQKHLFESAYDMFKLVPEEYLKNLNSYYRVLYMMVKDKDWNSLLKFSKYNFKFNPNIPKELDQKYAKELNFNEDSHFEKLDSSTKNAYPNGDNFIIEFRNFVPFNFQNNFENTIFKLIDNESNEIILDSSFIDENKLSIPIDMIKSGENKILTAYYYDNIKKESYMKSGINKTFILDDIDLTIKRGKIDQLKLIKREKNNNIVTIEEVKLNNGKFIFLGHSDKKLKNILINDYLDIEKFKYSIEYLSETEFKFEIEYVDFLKAPIKKWNISSEDIFSKFELLNEYEFLDKKYKISIKNDSNLITVNFELYDSLNEIKKLNNATKKIDNINYQLNHVTNKFNSLLLKTHDIRTKLWEDINNSKNVNDYILLNEKYGTLNVIDHYKQLDIHANDPLVVRVLTPPMKGDLEIIFEIKVSDYANIGISSSDSVTQFAYIRISNRDWIYYRFTCVNNIITAYMSNDSINWKDINLTENKLNNNSEYQFQFNSGYSNSYDKKTMIRNLRIYKI